MAFGVGNLGSLIVKIETDLTNFNSGLNDAQSKMQKTTGAILNSTSAIGRSFTVMGAAIMASLVGVTKAAIDYEDAFAGVRKTVDATEEEFQQISDTFRDLATEIPIAADELAGIGEIAGQLGIRGVDNITKFTETIAKIGVTTNLSSQEAATAFARIANVMKEPIENVDRMGAVVVDLGNNFAANEQEIVNFSTRIAAAGSIAGLTTGQIFAIGAAFTAVGVPAEAGGTAVQKVLNQMTQAAAEGGEQLELFALTAGMTVDEFSKLQELDPGQAFLRFVEGLGEAGDQSFAILQAMGLQNERVIRSFLSMAKSSGTLEEALGRQGEAWEENKALEEEAQKRFETTASQLKILLNNIVEVARKIGDTLLPVIKKLVDDIKPVVQSIGEWIREHPKLTENIAKTAAVIGTLMVIIGPLLLVLPTLAQLYTILSSAITAASTAGTVLNTALGLLGPVIGVVAAAWAGWKIGSKIAEIDSVKEALSGPDGFFTKMFINLDKSMKGWELLWKFIRGEDIPVLKTVTPEEMEAGERALAEAQAAEKEAGERALAEAQAADRDAQLDAEQEAADMSVGIAKKKTVDLMAESAKVTTDKIKNETDIAKKIKEIKDKADKEDKARDDRRVRTKMQFLDDELGNLAANLKAAEGLNKGFAKASAAISMGLAITRTAAGATKAYEDYGWPWGLVAAGIIIAAGAIQVATIASQEFAGGTDSVPAMLTPGEIVVPRTFSDAIRAGDITIGGAGGGKESTPTVININFDNVKISNDLDIDQLTEMIGENIEEKMRGLR